MSSESCPASVLVVEDDEAIRESIGDILEAEGYDVALAENGEHALHLLSDVERPCLVLVDLIMPKMDACELLRVLSRNDRLATIPVVVISAANRPALIEGQRLLKKPVDLEILLRIVPEHCCGERGSDPGARKPDRVTPVD